MRVLNYYLETTQPNPGCKHCDSNVDMCTDGQGRQMHVSACSSNQHQRCVLLCARSSESGHEKAAADNKLVRTAAFGFWSLVAWLLRPTWVQMSKIVCKSPVTKALKLFRVVRRCEAVELSSEITRMYFFKKTIEPS